MQKMVLLLIGSHQILVG